jgi:hypothetical protein
MLVGRKVIGLQGFEVIQETGGTWKIASRFLLTNQNTKFYSCDNLEYFKHGTSKLISSSSVQERVNLFKHGNIFLSRPKAKFLVQLQLLDND